MPEAASDLAIEIIAFWSAVWTSLSCSGSGKFQADLRACLRVAVFGSEAIAVIIVVALVGSDVKKYGLMKRSDSAVV